MMRPMRVITTSISTSVKPCWPSLCRPPLCSRNKENRPWRFSDFMMNPILDLADKLSDRQQRGHNRYDQPTYDRTDGDDGERPDDAHDPIEAALQFRLVEFGDPARQHRQLPGFLAQPQHANRHRRKAGRRGQGVRELAAITHASR